MNSTEDADGSRAYVPMLCSVPVPPSPASLSHSCTPAVLAAVYAVSVRNGSRLCAAAVSTERLLNTIGALATARDSPPSLRKRHLHLAMHSSACRAAAREQAWSEARQRWAKEQHGEVRVTVH